MKDKTQYVYIPIWYTKLLRFMRYFMMLALLFIIYTIIKGEI